MQSGKHASQGASLRTLHHTSTKEPNQTRTHGRWRQRVVSNCENTFCNIYFKTLMDNDNVNVNYTTIAHKDSWNRGRNILVRAWTQTLSAHPRNKEKSGETDSPPGGVRSWGHWEDFGGRVCWLGSSDLSAPDPLLEWGLCELCFSSVRMASCGFFQWGAMRGAWQGGQGKDLLLPDCLLFLSVRS